MRKEKTLQEKFQDLSEGMNLRPERLSNESHEAYQVRRRGNNAWLKRRLRTGFTISQKKQIHKFK